MSIDATHLSTERSKADDIISVLIVDDQPLIRKAVKALIDEEPGMTVIAEATNGFDAVNEASTHNPDVVLMDIRMPDMDGLEATRRITGSNPHCRVLILTTFEEEENLIEALRGGASGFIGKTTEPQNLISAIRTISGGESLLSPAATRSLIDRYVRSSPTPHNRVQQEALKALTEREREVLQLVGQGLSNEGIGRALNLSPATVKTHVNRTMMKLAAHDRAQLVIVAYESGLVRPAL